MGQNVANLPPYAVRAIFDPWYNRWFLEDLILDTKGDPRWKKRRELIRGNFSGPAIRDDEQSAKAEARQLSRELSPEIDLDRLSENGLDSTSLKLAKAVVASQRLEEEEALMFVEARRRNSHLTAPPVGALSVTGATLEEIAALHAQLAEFPYLRTVAVGRGMSTKAFLSPDGLAWSRATPGHISRRGTQIVHRAKTSEGFGISPLDHWGSTKAKIRQILLPRAIQLLQLEPMKELLAKALAEGRTAVVLDRFVFWYESDGQIGWTVKELGNSSASEASTSEWSQGKIVSTNFGRIVVLPFTKANGERVNGYTRNGPKDGPAKPRLPGQAKEIPFSRLGGDTVLGLLGELPYGP